MLKITPAASEGLHLGLIPDEELRELLQRAQEFFVGTSWPIPQKKVARLIRSLPNFKPSMTNPGLFNYLHRGVVKFEMVIQGSKEVRNFPQGAILAFLAYLDTRNRNPQLVQRGVSSINQIIFKTQERLGKEYPLSHFLGGEEEVDDALTTPGRLKILATIRKGHIGVWLTELSRQHPYEAVSLTRFPWPSDSGFSPLASSLVVQSVMEAKHGSHLNSDDVNVGGLKKALGAVLLFFDQHPEIETLAQVWQTALKLE